MSKQKEIQVNFNFHYHFSDSKKVKQKKLKKVEDDYKLIISNLQETIQNLSEAKESIDHLPSEFYVKKGIRIRTSDELINKFEKIFRKLFSDNNMRLYDQSYNQLKLWIYNIEEYLIQNYGSLLEPTDEEMKALKRRGKYKEDVLYSNEIEIIPVHFTIEEIYFKKFYRACFSFYKHKEIPFKSYSSSQFFNDVMLMIDEIEMKFYSLEFINSKEAIRQNGY